MAFVIYHPDDGVYLGSCMGLGFWSALDPVGQPSACTFATVSEAEAHMAEWECGRPQGIEFVEVAESESGYASMQACVLAGLPAWQDEQTPVANVLPV